MSVLGQYLARPPRYGIGAAAVPQGIGLPNYIRITDIDDDGNFSPNPAVSVNARSSGDYLLQDGDLVIARTGASVGKSYQYRVSDGELVFAGFLICVRPDAAVLDPQWLGQYLRSRSYWNWVASESTRSGQPGINARQLALLPIDVPSITDQRLIAGALADADDQVASFERLIIKKRNIKQGTMQELLTGRTRLPGFNDVWTTKRLSTLGSFLRGRGVRRDDVRSSGVPCIRYGEIYTTYTDYTSSTVSFVDSAVAATALPIRVGDVLFAGSGETKEEIGTSVAYVGNTPAVAGGDIIVLRGSEYDPIYLASLLNSPAIASQKARGGQGDAVVHINWTVLASLELTVPELTEQRAIALVLKDSDTEIEVLERRLNSARAIKTGMMQELLSGRTRLPVEELAA